MATEKRWQIAQEYERNHWKGVADAIGQSRDDLSWYAWRADRLRKLFLAPVDYVDTDDTSTLEIGSGPVGVVSFLKGRRRCAIDPLSDFYSGHPSLVAPRDPAVEYVNGGGESLPFEDGSFNLVIIENVIDHTRAPGAVLNEIHRVLKPAGLLFLSVNVHTLLGLSVRRAMEWFTLDRGHPHNFTDRSIRERIEQHGFRVKHDKLEDRQSAKSKERQAGRLRNRLKLTLGIYDILYEVLAIRP